MFRKELKENSIIQRELIESLLLLIHWKLLKYFPADLRTHFF